MINKYLDFTGLSTYDQKIKEYIGDHSTVIDETLTQEGEAADAKVTGDQIKNTTKSLAAIPGENIIALTDFTDTSHATYTVEEDTITVTAESGTYPCAQTADTWIASHLVVGRTYRLYAKAEKVSGNPNIRVCIRGVSGNENGIAKAIVLNDGGEGFIDFVADAYMKRVTLMIGAGTSVTGASVSFSDIWLKEYNTTGVDYTAREDVDNAVTTLESEFKPDYVHYYGNNYHKAVTSSQPAINIVGDVTTIDGTQAKNNRLFIKLSGNHAYTGLIANRNAWPREVDFQKGHLYRISCRVLGGVGSGSINVWDETSNNVVAIPITDTEKNFTWPNDNKGLIYFYRDLSSTSNITYTNFQFKLTIEDITLESKLSDATPSQLVYERSKGQLREYASFDVPMQIYKLQDGATVKSKTVMGTGYISIASSSYLVNILCGNPPGSTYFVTGKFYIYFYDENKNPIWTYLNVTDDNTGERNIISVADLKNLNGFQFTNITAGHYIRLAPATDCAGRVIVWTGSKSNYPPNAISTIITPELTKLRLPEDGTACIEVPEHAVYAIAKPGYTFLDLYMSNTAQIDRVTYPSYRFPSQFVWLTGFGNSGRNKNLTIVKNYDYETGTYSENLDMPNGDISDYVYLYSSLSFSSEKQRGYHQYILSETVNDCMNFTWQAKKDIVDCFGGTSQFHEGVTYHGIPYRSNWNSACFVGWHVTKHTFMNAANDPDSIFYTHSETKVGPYYSLVCSSYTTLIGGFYYPVTNFGLIRNPDFYVHKDTNVAIGAVSTNATGHCIVPLAAYMAEENNTNVVEVTEETGPITAVRNIYSGIPGDWEGSGPNETYLARYEFCVTPKFWNRYVPYNIKASTLKNGTARPHRGDRSVYTSAMNVLINIKDAEATRLYYQKFNVTCDHGVPGTFTADGDPQYVAIASGATQVNLRGVTIDGNHSGVELVNGGVYGVWASVDDTQSTAPSNVEYFEWYDKDLEDISYSISQGILSTDDTFWYAVMSGRDYINPVTSGETTGGYSVPYQAESYTRGGTPLGYHDYSKYADYVYFTRLQCVFKKGKFGAYMVNYSGHDPEIPDDDPDNNDPEETEGET